MIRLALRSAVAVVILTVVVGLVYPLVMTGFARVAFPNKSNGSLIERDGKVVGSKLAAQKFTSPRYFHSRPSAVDYNAAGTSFANYGPTSPELAKAVRSEAAAILKLERPYNPGLRVGDIPVDAVTTSASGIDPDISPAYARLQAARIAAVRGLSRDRVHAAHRRQHGRALARLPRRARRQRPRAQPRARQGAGMSDRRELGLHAGDRRRGDSRLVREARPADPVPQPGHVHRRDRLRDHDGASSSRRASTGSPASWRCGCG